MDFQKLNVIAKKPDDFNCKLFDDVDRIIVAENCIVPFNNVVKILDTDLLKYNCNRIFINNKELTCNHEFETEMSQVRASDEIEMCIKKCKLCGFITKH